MDRAHFDWRWRERPVLALLGVARSTDDATPRPSEVNWNYKTAPADQNTTMTAAANTPHTITNALMICFSSETDIGQNSVVNDPGLGGDRGRHPHESALQLTHAQGY